MYKASRQRGILTRMPSTALALFVTLVTVFSYFGHAFADYMLILKNGRRIAVQSYREEGGIIKFPGLGGEIGIGKDQIQAIRKAGETEPSGFNVARPEPTTAAPANELTERQKKVPSPVSEEKIPGTEETLKEQRAKEEKQYQKRIREITEQLKELRERYAIETRGNTGPDPAFFTTEEAFRGHQEDLLSRLRDAQYRAQGLDTGGSAASPPFSMDAPPAYTAKQKRLSDLRNQIDQLESRRQLLIDEMRQKGFDTGSLFLE
jgi:hypothetical protein